jgi:hypothetical protein
LPLLSGSASRKHDRPSTAQNPLIPSHEIHPRKSYKNAYSGWKTIAHVSKEEGVGSPHSTLLPRLAAIKELACNQYLTHQDFAWQWLARYLLIIGGIEN